MKGMDEAVLLAMPDLCPNPTISQNCQRKDNSGIPGITDGAVTRLKALVETHSVGNDRDYYLKVIRICQCVLFGIESTDEIVDPLDIQNLYNIAMLVELERWFSTRKPISIEVMVARLAYCAWYFGQESIMTSSKASDIKGIIAYRFDSEINQLERNLAIVTDQ